MFQSSDYLAGVSSAPPPDLMNEIGDVVKTEVNTISQDIAQRVADQAASSSPNALPSRRNSSHWARLSRRSRTSAARWRRTPAKSPT